LTTPPGARGPRDSAFKARARRAAIAWKSVTPVLTEAARADGQYRGGGPMRAVCLPAALAVENLLPEARANALEIYGAIDARWHHGVGTGPSNHLLSSQMQCANALAPMADRAELVVAAFGDVLPIHDVLDIEAGRYVTFEYIGGNVINEAAEDVVRTRGANFTSADAAIRYRTPSGEIEIALIEWKYTEDYRFAPYEAAKQATRDSRYRSLWDADHCPVRRDLIPYEDLFVEPFYQLFRQQLLAAGMQRTCELGASRVRVVHIAPAMNDGYRDSLSRDSHRAAGATVTEAWLAMVRDEGSFIPLDSTRFTDPARELTSAAYRARYTDMEVAHD
jgi:hypothetical protein